MRGLAGAGRRYSRFDQLVTITIIIDPLDVPRYGLTSLLRSTIMAVNGQQPLSSYASTASDAGSSVVQRGFKVTTRKLPILKAEPIDEMTKQLGITPPEMIFGDNLVSIEHIDSGWRIQFTAFEALDQVDKTSQSMLQVAHSKEWQSNRYAG